MEGRELSSRFPCVTPGVWKLSLSFIACEVVECSACGVFVDDLASGVWFLFCWRPMPLKVMGVGFGNTCTVSIFEHWVPINGTPTQRVFNRWLCLRFSIRGTPAWILWVANFWFWLYEICVQSQWGHEILRLYLRTPTLAARVSIVIRIESLFTIFVSSPTSELCLKNNEGKAESIIKWRGWGGSSLHGKKKWRRVHDPFKIS